jgi:thiol:disulfide interchange protein DsbA
MMERRHFALGLAAAPLLRQAAAQGAEPVEGKDYTRLPQPLPVAVQGKIEVSEFFGYWCPHCRSLEHRLEAWAKKLPPDVAFRRVPVSWQPQHEPYQRLYYALEALGLGGDIHQKVFDAVQVQGLRFEMDAAVAAFAGANGIDKAKLLDAIKGFSATNKARVATQLFKSHGLRGVPALAVHGRFVTSPEQTGGDERMLQVVDALIRRARTSR